jgi:hypothetical protein
MVSMVGVSEHPIAVNSGFLAAGRDGAGQAKRPKRRNAQAERCAVLRSPDGPAIAVVVAAEPDRFTPCGGCVGLGLRTGRTGH